MQNISECSRLNDVISRKPNADAFDKTLIDIKTSTHNC